MKIDGACHCGYIRVEGEADPEKTTVCHCTDCQVGAGSAFRVNVPVPGATFRITGHPATYLKTTGLLLLQLSPDNSSRLTRPRASAAPSTGPFKM
jgi:hypothetical protein